jgi:formylmethanofuran dehydrogenase subunit E
MHDNDVDVLVIEAAAARGCDQCGAQFHHGRVTVRGDEVLAVICAGCIDDIEYPVPPKGRLH